MSFKEAIQRAIERKKLELEQREMAFTEDFEAGEKILFTGLDNSGKSSIILSLQSKYSKIATLQPTRQTERTSFAYLGNRITRWDMGGQQRYRISYLQNPGKYFDRTAICIFVVDVQDTERIDEALEYYQSVLNTFNQLNISPPIYVFLHKADPEWMQSTEDYQASYVDSLENRFRDATGENFQLFFQITSIFDPWTVISSFSEVLLHLYPKSELVDRSIQEFARKLEADGMVVLDNNALILGQYYKQFEEKLNFESILPYVLQLWENFRTVQRKVEKMALKVDDVEYMFRSVTDPSQTEERYVFVKAPFGGINDDDFTEFGNILVDLLSRK